MSENKKRKIDSSGYSMDDGYQKIVQGQSDATLSPNFSERPDKVQKANEYPEDINYSQQDQLQREYIYGEYLQQEQQRQYLKQQQQQDQESQQRQYQIQSNMWNQAEQFIKKSGLESYVHQ
jgi:hypothetical protein